MQNLTNNGFLANENDELRRRAQSTSSASFGWGKIQNFESSITSNNQSDVDIAISPLNLNTPADRQMLARTETSAFIATDALSATPKPHYVVVNVRSARVKRSIFISLLLKI